MPGMNGFQATRTLSRDPATADVPIVMITTKSMETDRVWGLRQGARAFITKPVNEKELLAGHRYCCRQAEGAMNQSVTARLSKFWPTTSALSLAHASDVPEQVDSPGLWRGIGFRVGSRRLVSGIDEINELLAVPPLTHVPGTQPWLLGVANVRGNLVPVVDWPGSCSASARRIPSAPACWWCARAAAAWLAGGRGVRPAHGG